MKSTLKVFALALLSSVLALATLAQGEDLSGRWTAALQRDSKSWTFRMNLKVSANYVTGTIDLTPDATAQIENGKLEGNQLTFDVTAPEHGHTKPIHFVGDFRDGVIILRNESRGKQGRTMTFHRESPN